MQLTLFSDYSLRMLMYLGMRRGEVVPIVEIAESFGVSRHYMLKVMNELVQLGYIEAVRGRGGGVRLLKRPTDVRLGKLIRRTEPDRGVLDCVDDTDVDCPIVSACRLRKVFSEAQREFYRVLDDYTLADLIDRPNKLVRLLGTRSAASA
ncbi:MAG: Rrf2 family transcriptional regulator [Myxococcales bacterium]|nr:Rrf2 family transcriptional regulator [Myxococcales bacterium]